MESAFHLIGIVTLIVIALMAVMKRDAVSITDIRFAGSLTMIIYQLVILSVCTAELLDRK
jgi:hypothetical protein